MKNFSAKIHLIFLIAVCFPLKAFSWGVVGHRAVAIIAQTKLSPSAQSAVKRLLGEESIVDVANWADMVRETDTYKQTHGYHFEKIPDHVLYFANLKGLPLWQQKKSGVVGAIIYANKVLRDPSSPLAAQTDALKFLVHFVGDIHQPLHSGRPDDIGGIKVQVNWFGDLINLHKLWDTTLIMTGHDDILHDLWSFKASSAYAQYLLARPMPPVVEEMDIEGWLNESLELRLTLYDPIYNTDSKKYQAQHLPEIDQRIYSAGVRLATLLNSIYANEPTPVIELQLQSEIESISGSIDQLISFKP